MGIKVVGLTGGIACGKSTVAEFLREMGVPVVGADEIARAVVEPGRPAHAEIVEAFGREAVTSDGRIDRTALAARVFRAPAERMRLEAITHPRIVDESLRRFAALEAGGARAVVYEAALLVETGRYEDLDALLVVSCSPEVQRRRLAERDGLDETAADERLAAQMPLADKEALADIVIHNDGDLGAAREHTRVAWHELERRLGAGAP